MYMFMLSALLGISSLVQLRHILRNRSNMALKRLSYNVIRCPSSKFEGFHLVGALIINYCSTHVISCVLNYPQTLVHLNDQSQGLSN